MNEALAGFSDPNVVLIALLFVIGEGLVRTGVAQRLGDWLVAKAGSSETRLLVLLMLVVRRARLGDELDRRWSRSSSRSCCGSPRTPAPRPAG